MSEWISIKEKMPNLRTRVFVKYHGIDDRYLDPTEGILLYSNMWITSLNGFRTCIFPKENDLSVSFWMPLPEPIISGLILRNIENKTPTC